MKTIDELLTTPCWIVDILPERVPAHSPGQYFAVEAYYLAETQFSRIKQKHVDIVLKLNCYTDLTLDEETRVNPDPAHIARAMRERYVCILLGSAMIVSQPDETHLTVYNPDEDLLDRLRTLAAGEGLFVWKGEA